MQCNYIINNIERLCIIGIMSKTLYEKIWDIHVVDQEENKPAIIYIDLHLVHEVTSPQAFE